MLLRHDLITARRAHIVVRGHRRLLLLVLIARVIYIFILGFELVQIIPCTAAAAGVADTIPSDVTCRLIVAGRLV